MNVVKLSVSLDGALVEFIAQYQKSYQVPSKSEVVTRALLLLREQELESQYAASLEEWQISGEADLWEAVTPDSLTGDVHAPR